MKKSPKSIIVFIFLLITINSANASLTGPDWPAPGGTTFNADGPFENIGKDGGITFSYSGFDLSGLNALYWGPWDANSIGISLDDNNSYEYGEILNLYTIEWGMWQGGAPTRYLYKTSAGWTYWADRTLTTRLIMTVKDSDGNPINFIDSSTLGLTNGAVVPVTGDFTVHLQMLAYFERDGDYGYHNIETGWHPVIDGFNLLDNYYGYRSNTTFSGGMFYELVPIPGAVWLLGSGLIGLVAIRRKFKK